MRSCYVILIIVFLITGSANAMDVLLGTVQSVEPESGRVVLEVIRDSDESENDDPDTPKEMSIQMDPDRLPPCVTVGRIVRVWGDYLKEEDNQFKVLHISGGGFGNQKTDPTGVRSRIGRGMGGFRGGGMGGMKGRRGH